MPWSLHKQPPLTAREIEAIKKALASGVTMDRVRKRFHRSPKLLKKLYQEVLFPGKDKMSDEKPAPNMDPLGWNCAVEECLRQNGPPKPIGSFEPELGDIAMGTDDRLHVWTGTNWHPPVQP